MSKQKARKKTKSRGMKTMNTRNIFMIKDALESLEQIDTKPYDVTLFYKTAGTSVRLCKSHVFENLTFFVIVLNAAYIGFDSDYNTAELITDAHFFFQVCECCFAIYFTFELGVRFLAFEKKRYCLRDNWFRFDSVLVGLMILETWLVPLFEHF